MKKANLILIATALNNICGCDPEINVDKSATVQSLESECRVGFGIMLPEDLPSFDKKTTELLQEFIAEQMDNFQPKELAAIEAVGWLPEVETPEAIEEAEVVAEAEAEAPVEKSPLKVVKEVEGKASQAARKEKEPVVDAGVRASDLPKTQKAPKGDKPVSNKEIVYTAWEAGEKDQKKLFALVQEAVKEATIKAWIGSWVKGKNLPACATK